MLISATLTVILRFDGQLSEIAFEN
jgi:hypothetical protein